jgi:hypothetical protein
LAELFANEGSLDSDSLKASRIYFERDFDGYIDNLLAPEKRATSPSSSDIINGFSLEDDNHYNEFQWLMLEIDCPAHQHEQKICSLAS